MKREKGAYPIKAWPEGDRPREKLLEQGPESLSDAELLAIVIRTGDSSSGRTALDHARQLLTMFKSFRNLASAAIGELCALKGIGPAKRAALLKHFGSVEGIKKATLEELAAVKGINPALAEKLHAQFSGEPLF